MATVTVKIPTPLRKHTGGLDRIEASGDTVGDVLADVGARHPGIATTLYDQEGRLRRYINVYANQDDIRFLDNLQTEVTDGDELSVIPAIAGGSCR